MDNPLVSIIIPVYQVSDYIERCLESVISQTYSNIECILVNDATKDDSIDKCEKLIAEYEGAIHFSIINHQRNRGLSAARNTGIDASTGGYLYFLDSDDYITPNCIETMVSIVKEDDSIEMVQGNYLKITGDEEVLGNSENVRILSNDEARDYFLNRRVINNFVWNKLLKKSFIIDNGLYNEEGIILEDLLWISYVIKCLGKAVIINALTYYYLLRSGSIMTATDQQKMGRSYAIVYNEILDNLTTGRECEELFGYLYKFCYLIIMYEKSATELKDVLDKYLTKIRQFCGWKQTAVLYMAGILGNFGISPHLVDKLYMSIYKIHFKLKSKDYSGICSYINL